MKSYAHDLVISALSYDTMLIAELDALLSPRLRAALVWVGHSTFEGTDAASLLGAGASRVALVLHQRLWRHDPLTSVDDAVLQKRSRVRANSIIVVTLDDTPVPDWLADAPRCDLATVGVAGVADFALSAITASGGSLRPESVEPSPPVEVSRRPFVSEPTPFLAQPRAHTALRRELDSIADALDPKRLLVQYGTERVLERHSLPNRLIARLDDAGVSFSWVAGRLGTVADGRLLVIQWSGVTARTRGLSALKSATPLCERVYRAEAGGPDDWTWRADDPNGRACSTENLVAEWLAAAIASTQIATEAVP